MGDKCGRHAATVASKAQHNQLAEHLSSSERVKKRRNLHKPEKFYKLILFTIFQT